MSCKVIHSGAAYRGKQNLEVFEGVSAQSAGSKALCLHLVTIPPRGRAKQPVFSDRAATRQHREAG